MTLYKTLLKRLAFAFVFIPLIRLVFILYNQSYFSECSIYELSTAFFYGLRFDVATVLIINLFFILFSLLPIGKNGYELFLKFIFISFNSIFLIANIVDLEFFTFLGKKMTFDIFGIGGDIGDQMFQLTLNYWYLSIPSAGLIYTLWRFYPQSENKPVLNWKMVPLSISILIATGVGIRGGVQLRSISPKQAFIFEKHELGNAVLNAAYTLARSMQKKSLQPIDYFATDTEAINYIKSQRSFEFSKVEYPKTNIVILIIESLSQEYIEQGYTPKLRERFKTGLYFDRAYANGRRSIEALPSILLGLPSLTGKPIYQSQFQTNKFLGLPKILKDQGYHTSFFHGGKVGTMDFDAFVASIGVSEYFGKRHYPDQSHYDGNWGIFDHHFFDFFHQKLNQVQQPFFTTFFSLSSHQPYSIPAEYEGRFPKGELPIHESIGYADQAIDLFFQNIEKEPWYENTLFILTADHTQKLNSKEFNNWQGRYRVPIWFFHPQIDLRSLSKKKIVQHADIVPSILDFLGLKGQPLLFGTSIFSKDEGAMINYRSGQFLYLNTEAQAWEKNQDIKSEPINKSIEKLLKAYKQYAINGLIRNSF